MAELNRSVTLLACQIDVPAMTTAAERDAHTDRVAAAIDAELTAGGPVDLVVLPELGTLRRLDITIRKMKLLHG